MFSFCSFDFSLLPDSAHICNFLPSLHRHPFLLQQLPVYYFKKNVSERVTASFNTLAFFHRNTKILYKSKFKVTQMSTTCAMQYAMLVRGQRVCVKTLMSELETRRVVLSLSSLYCSCSCYSFHYVYSFLALFSQFTLHLSLAEFPFQTEWLSFRVLE